MGPMGAFPGIWPAELLAKINLVNFDDRLTFAVWDADNTAAWYPV